VNQKKKLLYAFEDSEAYSSFFVQEKAKPFFNSISGRNNSFSYSHWPAFLLKTIIRSP
jgi:hypothetical protein